MAISTVESPPALAWRPVALAAAVAAAVHLAVATRYGWHRDEFYYVICGRHPAWGYVDTPPLTPMLARIADLTPDTLLTLRLFAIAAQVGCIVLAALLAAEFGGRRVAQTIAAAAVAGCPVFVAASLLFGTRVTDQLIWVAVLMLVARALRVATVPAWLLAGAVVGIGLENKHTVAALLAGIGIGVLMYRREVLRTAGPWSAAAVAVLLAVPNVGWNAAHGWPNVQFTKVISDQLGGMLGSLTQLPMLVLLAASPLLVLLWWFGIRWLGSPAGGEHRWVLAATVVAFVLIIGSGGKPYYAAPVLAALFAAGAVRVESAQTAGLPRGMTTGTARPPLGWTAALAASFVAATLVCLPVLPVATANALRQLNPDLVETYGWPEFTDQVAAAAASLPADVPIYAGIFGEAGALSILGPDAGLHRPVYSAHNNYALWGPPSGSPDTVLCVGLFNSQYLRRYWSDVKMLAPIRIPNGVQNLEMSAPAKIFLCQQPRGSWAEMWPYLRSLS